MPLPAPRCCDRFPLPLPYVPGAALPSSPQVSVANVAVRWVMDQGPVTPIIGMRSAEHLEENARVLRLELDATDRAMIADVVRRAKGPKGDCYGLERGEIHV